MHIHKLDLTDRRDVRRFIRFPFHLYRDNPLWVPPFVGEIRQQLDPTSHPFYQHSQAAFFLALQDSKVAGRIAVIDNSRYNQHHGKRTAFFYHFDSVNDSTVSHRLLDAACDWARGRGLDMIWGPKGFITGDGQGILVEGYEHRPAMGIPYNYPYYSELLQGAGFEKKLDFISCYINRQVGFPSRFLDVAEKVKQRRGLRALHCRTKDELRGMIPQITAVYNRSFAEVEGYIPVTEAEAQAIANRILSIADPALISLLLKDEEIVGFVLAYPDLSAAVQRCRGRMWPTGWFHLMREFKRTSWINFNGAGIVERYRGLGGNALLYTELYHLLIDNPQYHHGDLVQVQETNYRMLQELEAFGVKPHKIHRLYQRSLS